MLNDEDEPIAIEPDDAVRALFASPGEFDLSQDDDLEVVLGETIEGTVVTCGQCGEQYLLPDEIRDERLFNACPDCVETVLT